MDDDSWVRLMNGDLTPQQVNTCYLLLVSSMYTFLTLCTTSTDDSCVIAAVQDDIQLANEQATDKLRIVHHFRNFV